jgi:hypothetical protein
MSTLCTLRYHLAHCAHCAHCCFSHWFLFISGPHWFRKGSNKLLLAAMRSNETRRSKTAGNIADGLWCCLWCRAEKPEKMTHSLAGGGYNSTGYIALLHPNDLTSRQPEYSLSTDWWLCWAKRSATSSTTSIPSGSHALV